MTGILSKLFNNTLLKRTAILHLTVGITFGSMAGLHFLFDYFNGKSVQDAIDNNVTTPICGLIKDEVYTPIKRRFTPEIEGQKFPQIIEIYDGFEAGTQYFAKEDRVPIPEDIAAKDFSWIAQLHLTETENGKKVTRGDATSFFIESPFPLPENTALAVTNAHVAHAGEELNDFHIIYKHLDKNGKIKTEDLQVLHKWTHAEYTKTTSSTPEKDVALLLVKVPNGVTIDKATPILAPDIPNIKAINGFGFAFNKEGLQAHFGAKTQTSNENVMYTYCDSSSEGSGGPITPADNNKKVIAITSGANDYACAHALLKNSILTDPKGFSDWIEAYTNKIKTTTQAPKSTNDGIKNFLFPHA